MNRRLESLNLMNQLQPFLQGGILQSKDAKNIIDEYISGNSAPLSDFIYSPDIPMQYTPFVKGLANYV